MSAVEGCRVRKGATPAIAHLRGGEIRDPAPFCTSTAPCTPGRPEVVEGPPPTTMIGRPIAVDVETVGLDPWGVGSRLRMVQVSDRPGLVYVDRHPGERIRAIIDAAPAIIGHNVAFDLLWLYRHGLLSDLDVALAKTVDTMAMAHLKDNRIRAVRGSIEDEWDEHAVQYVDDTAPGQALKDLARYYLGPGCDQAERELVHRFDLPPRGSASFATKWAAIPDGDLVAYAAADVDLTLRLLPHLRPEEPALLDIERRVAAVAARMTAHGFIIQTDQVEVARNFCMEELAQTIPQLRQVGIDSIAATGRGREQAEAALLAAGAPLVKTTPSGAYSLDRRVLEGLASNGYELAGLLHRARRADRFERDYLTKMVNNRGADGRLRPTISPLKARTGRWAIGGALPMQQMPRSGGFRECFTADPGKVLVAADYSSIEFSTLAVVTNDPGMLEVVETGADPYEATAAILWPGQPITRELRNQAKPYALGLGYGMGPNSLAEMSGRTLEEATALRNQLRRKWPGPSQTMTRIGHMYRAGIRDMPSVFGRRFQFPVFQGRVLQHAALNHANQGIARDLMVRDLLRVVDAGLEPWLTIHDEVIVQVDECDQTDALHALHELMNHGRHEVLGIPIRATAEVHGRSWRGK